MEWRKLAYRRATVVFPIARRCEPPAGAINYLVDGSEEEERKRLTCSRVALEDDVEPLLFDIRPLLLVDLDLVLDGENLLLDLFQTHKLHQLVDELVVGVLIALLPLPLLRGETSGELERP